jgi:hypothetical protein
MNANLYFTRFGLAEVSKHSLLGGGTTTSVIGAGVSVATSGQSEQTQQIWNQAYGVGSQ